MDDLKGNIFVSQLGSILFPPTPDFSNLVVTLISHIESTKDQYFSQKKPQ